MKCSILPKYFHDIDLLFRKVSNSIFLQFELVAFLSLITNH